MKNILMKIYFQCGMMKKTNHDSFEKIQEEKDYRKLNEQINK